MPCSGCGTTDQSGREEETIDDNSSEDSRESRVALSQALHGGADDATVVVSDVVNELISYRICEFLWRV